MRARSHTQWHEKLSLSFLRIISHHVRACSPIIPLHCFHCTGADLSPLQGSLWLVFALAGLRQQVTSMFSWWPLAELPWKSPPPCLIANQLHQPLRHLLPSSSIVDEWYVRQLTEVFMLNALCFLQRSVRESCEKIGSFLHEVCKSDEEAERLVIILIFCKHWWQSM